MTRREPDRDVRERVREAFDALLAQGVRPTGDRIVAWLLARYGKAGSLREIHPAFAELRDKRMKAASVRRFVEQYDRLDVLQREAVRKLLDALDAFETGSGDGLEKLFEAHNVGTTAFGEREWLKVSSPAPSRVISRTTFSHSMQEKETEGNAT